MDHAAQWEHVTAPFSPKFEDVFKVRGGSMFLRTCFSVNTVICHPTDQSAEILEIFM